MTDTTPQPLAHADGASARELETVAGLTIPADEPERSAFVKVAGEQGVFVREHGSLFSFHLMPDSHIRRPERQAGLGGGGGWVAGRRAGRFLLRRDMRQAYLCALRRSVNQG